MERKTLPEELVERIMAMVPFPYVFRSLEYFAQIYQSKSGTWSITQLPGIEGQILRLRSPIFFYGVLYMIDCTNIRRLVAYDQEAGGWKDFRLFTDDECVNWGDRWLVVCNSKLLLVVVLNEIVPDGGRCPHGLLVLHIDPVSRQALEVARGPPLSLNLNLRRFSYSDPVSHGNFIEVGTDEGSKKVVVFNALKDEWSFFDSPRANRPRGRCNEFQPGLSPFASVT